MLERLKEYYRKNKTSLRWALLSLPFGLSSTLIFLILVYNPLYNYVPFLRVDTIFPLTFILGIVFSLAIGVFIQRILSRTKNEEILKKTKLIAIVIILLLTLLFIGLIINLVFNYMSVG